MTAPDYLYALRCANGRRATKLHRINSETGEAHTLGYDAGARFGAHRSPPIRSVRDLADILKPLEHSPRWFIIRGQLRSGLDAEQGVNRQCRDHNPAPSWQAHPQGHRWLCIDLDDLPAPAWASATPRGAELPRLVQYAAEQLPDAFDDVTCFYQWSSSAGVKPWDCLRLHLWYWLERPAFDASLRQWAKAARERSGVPIDWKLYNPVQPHYTAAPLFEGAPDPLDGHRSGLLEQARDAVTLPDDVLDGDRWREEQARAERATKRARKQHENRNRYKPSAGRQTARTRYALTALDCACEAIVTAPPGTRHDTVFTEAASIGGLVGAGALSRSTAISALEQAALGALPEARHREARRTIADGIGAGEQDPRDLSHVGNRSRPVNRSSSSPDDDDGAELEAGRVIQVLTADAFAPAPAFNFGWNALPERTAEERAYKTYRRRQTIARYWADTDAERAAIELLSFDEWQANENRAGGRHPAGAATSQAS